MFRDDVIRENSIRRLVARGLPLCVCYGAATATSTVVHFPLPSAGIGVLWLPLGVLFGWLLRSPRVHWPGLLIWALVGQWLALLPMGLPLSTATARFAIDAAQVTVGVVLVQLAAKPDALHQVRGMLVLIFAGAVGPSLLFAAVRAAQRVLAGAEGEAWEAWCAFTTSNVLALLVIGPAVAAWPAGSAAEWWASVRGRLGEIALLAGALVGTILLIYVPVFPPASTFGFTAAAPLPLLLWAALRFGVTGVGVSVALLALVSGWLETGPFLIGAPFANVLAYQVFLCVVLVAKLVLVAALEERKQVGAEKAASDAHYRSLIEHQTEMVCRYRPDTTLTFVNQAYCRFRGLTKEELVGTRWIDRHPPEDAPRLLAMVQRVCDERLSGSVTLVQERNANGESGWTRWVDTVISDGAGGCEVQGMGHDVTDLVYSNEALRRSQERLNAAMDAAKLGVWEIDLTSDKAWWSTLLVDVAGRGASDFESLEVAIDQMIEPEDRGRIREQIAAIASGVGHTLRFRLRRPDGQVRWIEGGGGAVFDETGNPRWLTGIACDVTERIGQEAALRRAMESVEQLKNQLQADNAVLLEELSPRTRFGDLVFASEVMKAILTRADRVAPTETAVLITGETGTGKELLARAIHERSRRRERPLVRVNCAALHASLVESELFGHEKGAYTGAATQRAGRFEVADGGTLFLDEIGELSPDVQAKLLRVLQNGEFERLGSSKTISTNVRLIAATNRDLARAVREGTFRADLFYRLNVFPIHIPPLRERPEDVAPLAAHVLRNVSGRLGRMFDAIGAATLAALQQYRWPGNARELENVIERAAVLSNGSVLTLPAGWDISGERRPPKLDGVPTLEGLLNESTDATLESVERLHILGVLERTHWRIEGPRGAAIILGMNPSTLRSRLARLGIRPS